MPSVANALPPCRFRSCGGQMALEEAAAPKLGRVLVYRCLLCARTPSDAVPATPADAVRAARDAFVARTAHHRTYRGQSARGGA